MLGGGEGVGGPEALDRGREALDRGLDALERRRDAAVEAGRGAMERSVEAGRGAMERSREAGREAMERSVEAGREAMARVKPRLRGVSHEWAFFASLVLGIGLIVAAEGTRARWAVAIYAFSLSALFGVSALYHRVTWRRPEVRRWMRRLDHTMIFLLIAGTVTPFALLVLDGVFAKALLIAVWTGAAAGIVVELIWIEAPKLATAAVYIGVGSIGAVAFPAIVARIGVLGGALIALGGALYIAGALVYALQRPDPKPAVFGYHEIFHVLVIAAAAAHFAAVALYALPAS